jgi:hypothetical protein
LITAGVLLAVTALGACGSRTELWGGELSPSAGGGAPGWTVEAFRQTAVTKVDVLLTLDNSISMADKQALLAEAVPLLVQRLITAGSQLEPVSDVHVGVITSSLGSHGASSAKDVCVSAEDNDHAHLLGQLRALPGTWRGEGFLAWDPHGEQSPPGDFDPGVFSDKLRQQVRAAGEHGCGYEATLEAWYRFLIDPEPPLNVVVTAGQARRQGVDQEILKQRAAFLRPDSLVAIIMLSDENDCSLRDEGVGWLASSTNRLPRATSACAKNANDPCCQSCSAVAARGCPDPKQDAQCRLGDFGSQDDDLNLRCWQQKRRFGIDFLYPTTRYSDALKSSFVTPSEAGKPAQNPLFAAPDGLLPRDRSLVYLAGIVGVPWQDIADEQSLNGPGLRYLTATELADRGRWDVILGDPSGVPALAPSDPFMRETTQDRSQLQGPQFNPIVPSVQLVSSESMDPEANVINGHEQRDLGNDLQYACTFPLDQPRLCDEAALDADTGCDCFAEDAALNRSVCQPPGGGPPGILQRYAKAYPGLRHLQVLKEVGSSAIVASICPKVLDKASSDYGYNPAVEALLSRLEDSVFRRCLPHSLPFDADGRVPCKVVQAFPKEAGGCRCESLCMKSLSDPTLDAAVGAELGQVGPCVDKCAKLCRCELPQLEGAELSACQNELAAGNGPGFCYISSSAGEPNVGNAALLSDCPGGRGRDVRFLGGAPTSQVINLLACPTGP